MQATNIKTEPVDKRDRSKYSERASNPRPMSDKRSLSRSRRDISKNSREKHRKRERERSRDRHLNSKEKER